MNRPRNASTSAHWNTSVAHSNGVKLLAVSDIGQRSCCSIPCSVNIGNLLLPSLVREIGLVIELRDVPAPWEVLAAEERLATFSAMA